MLQLFMLCTWVYMCIMIVPHSDCHVFLLYSCVVGGHML